MWDREFTFRPYSQDCAVLAQVLFCNEYGLPDTFAKEDVVVDIGAHIGCFAVSVLRRGAGKVVCYEPDEKNFALLRRNVAQYDEPFGRVEVHNAALYEVRGRFPFRRRGPDTACGHVDGGADAGGLVGCETLDDVLQGLPKVRLLKLDCEGSEWGLLMTSLFLHRCVEVVAELHTSGPDDRRVDAVLSRLRKIGYRADATPLEEHQNALLLRATVR